jgi:photosystem II stability/assembly factor-like uncharacterized protein
MRFFSFLLLLCFPLAGDFARAQGQSGWVRVPSGSTGPVTSLSFSTKDTAYAWGDTPIRSIDGGLTWQSFATPVSMLFQFIDSRNGFQAGYSTHTAYHTNDGGQTWNSADDSCQLVTVVYPISKDTCFVMGDGFLSRTANAGKSWSPEFVKIETGAIAFSDSKHGIVVGGNTPGPLPGQSGGGCSITEDGGNYWQQVYTGAQGDFKGVVYLSPSTIVAVGVYDSVSRSTDGGKTWRSLYVPLPATTQEFSAVSAKGRRIIAVGPGGYIATCLDSGLTWQSEVSGVTVDLASIAMFDESTALAAGDKGVILRTTNGGTDWVQVVPPSPIPLQTHAFPQPETASQEIEYSLPQLQHVTVRVYDLTGHIIQTLLDKELQPAGEHRVMFRGDGLPAGTYIYHIDTERYHASGKSVLVK